MMIAVTFHHHGGAQTVDTSIECQDCAHHVHHEGHFLNSQYAMHDCVLCQLRNTPYTLPRILTLAVFIVLLPVVRNTDCAQRLLQANDAENTRAPPYFSAF